MKNGGDGEFGMISVDRWSEKSQAYFLTHLHADHTKGLSSKWSRGPLFCSPISATLFSAKFPGFDLSLLRVVELGKTHEIPMVSKSTGLDVVVQVTPIDACHCPGSVMYFFRGEFGCVLHTGDYRWEESVSSQRADLAKKILTDLLAGDRLDVLHLDNTYCHPSFSFPPRIQAAQQVVDIITSHPHHDIIIGVHTLGKEELLLHISETLKTSIWVWPERLRTMHLLGFDHNIFTTSSRITRIRAVPHYSLTIQTLEELNTMHPTIGIMPSGCPWMMKSLDGELKVEGEWKDRTMTPGLPQKYHQFAYSVPYSDHSCFNEISELVKLVRPSKIIGIVSSPCCINPRLYFSNSDVCCGVTSTNRHSFVETRSTLGKRLGFIQTQGGCEASKKAKVKKKKKKKTKLEVPRSRASFLRQDRHGVKLR